MENDIVELEAEAQTVFFALHLDGVALHCFRLSLVPIVVFGGLTKYGLAPCFRKKCAPGKCGCILTAHLQRLVNVCKQPFAHICLSGGIRVPAPRGQLGAKLLRSLRIGTSVTS